MIILTLRTDKPEAEVGIYKDKERQTYETWQAHRELAETIHTKLEQILNSLSISIENLSGVVVYKGPGSFTGLRIGLSVANALAYSLRIPIVAQTGNDWIERGIKELHAGHDDQVALPEYGSDVHITKPRK